MTGYKNIRIAANTAYPNATIGTGDVVVTSNPFVDSTRNLATWGGTAAGGGVATAAGAIATIAANPALISQAGTGLLSWVRAGFATTNAALSGSSYPGDTSTTDAAGNAWPGGTPGIGAMGYQSLGNAVLFATACDGGAFDFLTGGMVG